MNWYLGVSATLFLFFSIAWRADEWYNALTKLALIILSLIGFVLLAINLGFVVKL